MYQNAYLFDLAGVGGRRGGRWGNGGRTLPCLNLFVWFICIV